jgi:hypothetical protein
MTAPPIAVWSAPDTGWNRGNVWAPELHSIDGRWYIYYAGSRPGRCFQGPAPCMGLGTRASRRHRMAARTGLSITPSGRRLQVGIATFACSGLPGRRQVIPSSASRSLREPPAATCWQMSAVSCGHREKQRLCNHAQFISSQSKDRRSNCINTYLYNQQFWEGDRCAHPPRCGKIAGQWSVGDPAARPEAASRLLADDRWVACMCHLRRTRKIATHGGSANATYVSLDLVPSFPPAAAITTYWRPPTMYVLGVA